MSNLIPFPKEVPMKHKKAIEALKLWQGIARQVRPIANQETRTAISIARRMTIQAIRELKAA